MIQLVLETKARNMVFLGITKSYSYVSTKTVIAQLLHNHTIKINKICHKMIPIHYTFKKRHILILNYCYKMRFSLNSATELCAPVQIMFSTKSNVNLILSKKLWMLYNQIHIKNLYLKKIWKKPFLSHPNLRKIEKNIIKMSKICFIKNKKF